MTDTVKLDRSRPYGTVHGEDTGGAFFEQDGILFDNDGEALKRQLARNLDELVEKRERLMRAERAAKAAFAAAMSESGEANVPLGAAPVIVPDDVPPPATKSDDTPADEVDLKAWITGQAKYQFFSIQGALIRQFSFRAQTKAQAVDFLIEELKLQPEDVKVS